MTLNPRLIPVMLFACLASSTLLAQWYQTGGPTGGPVRALAISESILVAGTAAGGVSLSSDYGANWVQVKVGQPVRNVYALNSFPDGQGGQNLFAGTNAGVFLSKDNGRTWAETDSGIATQSITVFSHVGENLFAATFSGGVFRSTDTGKSWTPASNGLTSAAVYGLVARDTDLFAGISDGVFRSTDSGATWINVSAGQFIVPYVLSLGVGVRDSLGSESLFAGTAAGVYRSTDDGTTWTLADSGFSMPIPFVPQPTCFTVDGASLFAGTNLGILRSTDDGMSWAAASSGLTNWMTHCLLASDSGLFAGTDGGAFRSTNDGASWDAVNSGLLGARVSVLALVPDSSALFLASTDAGVYESADTGATWVLADSGLSNTTIHAFAWNPAGIYCATDFGVYRSLNHGQSWSATGLTDISVSSLLLLDSTMLAGTYGGVFISRDSGSTWDSASTGLTNRNITSVASSGTSLLAGTSGGGVFRSTNNGASWTSSSVGLTYPYVKSMATIGTTVFLGTQGGGAFRSTNNGRSWSSIGLSSLIVNAFVDSGANLFAATDGGVFLTTNNGAKWTEVDSGMTNTLVKSLVVCGSDLFAGTYGGSVWRRPLSELVTGVAAEHSVIPKPFRLYQNYPNPFNPTTVIGYDLPVKARVILKIYNVLGSEVNVLKDGIENPGHKTVEWNSTNSAGVRVASGVYFYRLETVSFSNTEERFVESRKMLMIR